MAIKKSRSHGNSLFSSPHPLDCNMLAIFSLKNVKQGQKLELTYLYACRIMHLKCCKQIPKWNAYETGHSKQVITETCVGESK